MKKKHIVKDYFFSTAKFLQDRLRLSVPLQQNSSEAERNHTRMLASTACKLTTLKRHGICYDFITTFSVFLKSKELGFLSLGGWRWEAEMRLVGEENSLTTE